MPPKPRVQIPAHVLVYTIGFIPGCAYGKNPLVMSMDDGGGRWLSISVDGIRWDCVAMQNRLDPTLQFRCTYAGYFIFVDANLSKNAHLIIIMILVMPKQRIIGTRMHLRTKSSKRSFERITHTT